MASTFEEMNQPRVEILGVPISVVTMEAALEYISQHLEQLRGGYVCAANVHTTVTAHENQDFLRVQKESVLTLPDGKPLAVIGKRKSRGQMEKVTGTHFMQHIFTDCRFAGKKHYFYGTRSDEISQMILRIHEDYPTLNICGYEASVFRELRDEEVDELAKRINCSGADFVWVALGAPRQEQLMYRMKGMTKSIMVGVGGAFHILSGKINDAPLWMQNAGLEWFYRLCKEPKRLFSRYLITNTKFLYYLVTKK